jgi:uncharacterized protein
MIPDVDNHRPQIQALCRKYHVKELELFGSAARGDAQPTSDLDFFVRFQDRGWRGSFKRYMGLKLDLEDLLGRSVDLVEIDAVTNPYFLETATQHRELLYAA